MNVKEIWKEIRKASDTNKSSNSDEKILNSMDTCNRFISHFAKIGESINKDISDRGENFKKFIGNPRVNSMVFEKVSETEITNIVSYLNDKKSSNDKIPLFLFKKILHKLLPFITSLINNMIMNGHIPSNLKLVRIVPIHKTGTLDDPNNYRPIALISYIMKICETAMYKRLLSYLNSISFLNENQYGFRNKHSCEFAFLKTTDNIYRSFESNKYIMGLFLDLKKAFDVVDIKILLYKLNHLGVRSFIFDWLKDYLTNRRMFIQTRKFSSNVEICNTGVPQGSALGPLLFLIYINDFCHASQKGKFTLYADDTCIFYEDSDIVRLQNYVNSDLKKISNWLNSNKLLLNMEKTCYMLFKKRNQNKDFELNIAINNSIIKKVSSVKYLGVNIDDKLNFKQHSINVIRKIRKNSIILRHFQNIFDGKILRSMYYALIYPHISYGLLSYEKGDKSDFAKIEYQSKRILRCVCKRKERIHIFKCIC